MKVITAALFLSLSTLTGASGPSAEQVLLNAISSCPKDQNPLSALQSLQGNSFRNSRFIEGSELGTVSVDVWSDHSLNYIFYTGRSYKVGSFEITMDYPRPQMLLQCQLTVKPD